MPSEVFFPDCLHCRQMMLVYNIYSVYIVDNKMQGKDPQYMKELSETEWHVLESLWADSPKVGSRIVADMEAKKGWSRSTTLTMLRRMTEKGLIDCDDGGKMKTYTPLVCREEAVKKETENFLNRVYQGSVGMLLNSFVEKKKLTAGEIKELRQILDQAEEDRDDC